MFYEISNAGMIVYNTHNNEVGPLLQPYKNELKTDLRGTKKSQWVRILP